MKMPMPTGVAGASGGGPVTASDLIAPAAPTPAAPSSAVAGDAGAGASLLGGGGTALAGALQQLVRAVQQLTTAIAGMVGGVAGGGATSPIQGPPPGKIMAGVGGGGDTDSRDPLSALSTTFETRIAAVAAGTPERTALEALRPQFAAIRNESNATSSVNPVSLLKLSARIETATLPATDPKRAVFDQIMSQADDVAAEANRTGSFNPASLSRIAMEGAVATGHIKPGGEQAAAAHIQRARGMEALAIFNPVDLQQLSIEYVSLVV